MPPTAAVEPTVVKTGAVTAADLAADGSRSVGWLSWILRFFGLGGLTTASFTLADFTGAFKGTTTAVKAIAVNNSSALLFLGVVAGAAIAIAVFMARQRIVDAAREGRYQPQQK